MNQANLRAARQAVETDILLGLDVVVPGAHGQSIDTAPGEAASAGVDAGDPGALLAALESEHANSCAHCTKSTSHTNLVFGEGSPTARLMFVGEAPGAREDATGRPFVGPAGQKLDEMISAMGLTRDSVYIANVLKARPPENRTPLEAEARACGEWLSRQIEVIQPEVVVALGGPAAKLLLATETGITRLRGAWSQMAVGERMIPLMPTFHPAYILRQYTAEVRRQVWEDLQLVMQKLGLEAN